MGNHFVQAGERAAADKQDLGGINLQELLLRMFTPALRWNGGDGAFDKLQQRLLYAFAGDVAGNRRVIGFTRNFVDFVDINDAALRFLRVVVALLQQFLNDIFDVLTHITRFGQGGGVCHGKRHIQQARQRFRQQRFTGTGRPDQQNVTFTQLYAIAGIAIAQTFVVVVYRDRQHFLRLFLTDDIVIKVVANLVRRRQRAALAVRRNFFNLFANDVVT